jgi:hypothetical protein
MYCKKDKQYRWLGNASACTFIGGLLRPIKRFAEVSVNAASLKNRRHLVTKWREHFSRAPQQSNAISHE